MLAVVRCSSSFLDRELLPVLVLEGQLAQGLSVLLPLDEDEAPVLEVIPALREARRLENLAFDLRRDRSGAKFAHVELRGDGFVRVQQSSRPLAMTGIKIRSPVEAMVSLAVNREAGGFKKMYSL